MKKLWLLLIGLALSPPLHADNFWSSLTTEEPVAVRYASTGLTASTTTLLIDLSDTVNFAHKFTGAIDILSINAQIDKVATSSGTLKIGVVTSITESSGTVKWFYEKSFRQSAAGTEVTESYIPLAPFRLYVNSAGNTPYLASGDKTTESTTFQTDVTLPTTFGSAAPGKGDIVVTLTNSASTSTSMNFDVEVLYNSER